MAMLDTQRAVSITGAAIASSCTVQRAAAFVDANPLEQIWPGGKGIGHCNIMSLPLVVVGLVSPDSQIAQILRLLVDQILRLSPTFSRAATVRRLRLDFRTGWVNHETVLA